MFRVTALCVLVSVGVVAILPRAAGGAGDSRAATETASPSALFADVRVPAEVVPVSIGRPIGSIAGSTFDAQVRSTQRLLAFGGGIGVNEPGRNVVRAWRRQQNTYLIFDLLRTQQSPAQRSFASPELPRERTETYRTPPVGVLCFAIFLGMSCVSQRTNVHTQIASSAETM